VYIDVLSLTLLKIIDLISIKNYKLYFMIRALIIFIVVISNYTLVYGYRVFISNRKNKNKEIQLKINTIYGLGDHQNKSVYSSNITSEISNTEESTSTDKRSRSVSILSKIEEYHNRRSINNLMKD